MGNAATIDIKGNNKPLESSLKDSEGMVKGWGSSVAGLVKGFAGILAGAFVFKKAFDFGSALVDAAAGAEESQAKLGAALKATGNAAGWTEEQLVKYSEQLQDITKFEAETTQEAMGILATFKNIRGDEFKQATALAQDMSTILGGDLKGSITQVAKALNDPIEGINALKRAGVSFTDEQKEQIKTLVQSGKVVEAQKIILGELKSEFGGAAEAVGKTFGGQMEIAKNKLGDVAENIGGKLIPIIQMILPAVDYVQAGVDLAFDAIATAYEWIKEASVAAWAAATEAANPLIEKYETLITTVGKSLMPILESLYGYLSDTLSAAWEAVAAGTAYATGAILDGWGALLDFITPIYGGMAELALKNFRTVEYGITTMVEAIQPILTALYDFWTEVWTGMEAELSPVFDGVMEIVQGAFDWIMSYVGPIYDWLADAAVVAFTAIETVLVNFSDVAKGTVLAFALSAVQAFENIYHFIGTVIPEALIWFGENWEDIFTDIVDFTMTVFDNLWYNITEFFAGLGRFLSTGSADWEFKALTDGFEASLKTLPKIAEREIGPLEKQLRDELGEIAGRTEDDFNKRLAKNKKGFGDARTLPPERPPRPEGPEIKPLDLGLNGEKPPEDKADQAKLDAERTASDGDDKKKKAAVKIEGLEDLNQRITLAAANEEKDAKKEKKADERNKDAEERAKKNREAAKDNTDALKKQTDETKKQLAKSDELVTALHAKSTQTLSVTIDLEPVVSRLDTLIGQDAGRIVWQRTVLENQREMITALDSAGALI